MKLYARDSVLDLSSIHVMGILNMTPDSFFDGGKYNSSISKALKHVNKMIDAGATIIDVGGESTRPGASEISVEEELDRVVPIVSAIASRFEIWISIDTSRPEVMRETAHSGVHLINDIRALQLPGALQAAADINLPICLVHNMQGPHKTMQQHAPISLKNIFREIDDFFATRIASCEKAGIKKNKLLIDPGFGFGKTVDENYQLLAHLTYLHHFGLPLLVGISRKSMINQILQVSPIKSLIGSITGTIIAALQGVHILRVHDVQATIEAMRIIQATLAASTALEEDIILSG
ncbi:MAG: dihydropteroate synthase [Candidatus Dasytiphilus stammeri]